MYQTHQSGYMSTEPSTQINLQLNLDNMNNASNMYSLSSFNSKTMNRSINLNREKTLTERVMLIEKKKNYSQTIRERNMNLLSSCSNNKKKSQKNKTINDKSHQNKSMAKDYRKTCSKGNRQNIENSLECCTRKQISINRNLSIPDLQLNSNKNQQSESERVQHFAKNYSNYKRISQDYQDIRMELNKTCKVKYSVFDQPYFDQSANRANKNMHNTDSNNKNCKEDVWSSFIISQFQDLNDPITPMADNQQKKYSPRHTKNELQVCSQIFAYTISSDDQEKQTLRRQNKTFKADLAKYRKENSQLIKNLQKSQNLSKQLQMASKQLVQNVHMRNHKCPKDGSNFQAEQAAEIGQNSNDQQLIKKLLTEVQSLKQEKEALRIQNLLNQKKLTEELSSNKKKMLKQISIWQQKYQQQVNEKLKYHEIRQKILSSSLDIS